MAPNRHEKAPSTINGESAPARHATAMCQRARLRAQESSAWVSFLAYNCGASVFVLGWKCVYDGKIVSVHSYFGNPQLMFPSIYGNGEFIVPVAFLGVLKGKRLRAYGRIY